VSGDAPHRRLTPGPFALGVLTGVIVPVALFLSAGPLMKVLLPEVSQPRYAVDVASAGEDISAHGGVRLEVVDEHGVVSQSCRGRCDDLRFLAKSGDNSYAVRVLDKDGACVACGGAGYVTGGIGTWVTRFDVVVPAGRDRLEVVERTLHSELP
jgi:hypothetical protein